MGTPAANAKDRLTTDELANRWSMSSGALINWRDQSQGPRYIKVGRLVRYRLEDILEYERKNLKG